MRIAITGVPGTGKTTLAKALAARLNYPLISLSDFLPLLKNKERNDVLKTYEVDVKELEAFLQKEIKELRNAIVEGHLIADMNIKWDVVIVMRAEPKVLEKRLKARGYPEKKVRENVEAEMIDYCGYPFENAIYLNGALPVEENVRRVLEKIRDAR